MALFNLKQVAAALALAGLLPALAQADVVRVGVAAAGGGDPVTFGGTALSLARNQQLLEKAFAGSGTEVQWFFFKGAGPAVNEALSNNQIDFAYEGDLPAVVARANGLETTLLAALGTRSPIYIAVPKGSAIHNLADLKGKQVGLFRGTNLQLLFDKVLAGEQLSERDLKVINLDTGSIQAALVSKGIDAGVGGNELFKLRDQGLVDIIWGDKDRDPVLTRQTALLVRSAYAKDHPQQTQKVVDTVVQAARWGSDPANQQAVYEEFAKSGVPVSSWQAEFADGPLSVRLSPVVDPYLLARYQAVAEQAYKERLIRREVKIDGWFDTRFLDQALKAQQLQGYWSSFDANGKALPAAATASVPAEGSQEHSHEPG